MTQNIVEYYIEIGKNDKDLAKKKLTLKSKKDGNH